MAVGSPGWRQALRAWPLAAAASFACMLPGCAWLADQQRELLYRPTPGVLAQWHGISDADEPLWLTQVVDEQTNHEIRALWIPQKDPRAPAVLYLHGTFRNLFQNRPKIEPIYAAGYSVLAIDYRGWGESTDITPSEASILADAEVAWREFAWRVPDARRRVVYGHSMGSGVAIELARRHQGTAAAPGLGALVVEAAFTSMPDIARPRGTLGRVAAWLTTEQFNSIDKIPDITVPKWFLVGTADNTVPPMHSQALFNAATQPKSLIVFDGGSHSRMQEKDPDKYRATWQEVARWLAAPAPAAAPAGRPAPQ